MRWKVIHTCQNDQVGELKGETMGAVKRYLLYVSFCAVWAITCVSAGLSEDACALGAVILAAGWLSGYKPEDGK